MNNLFLWACLFILGMSLPLGATQPLRKIPVVQADGSLVHIEPPIQHAHKDCACQSRLALRNGFVAPRLSALNSSTPDGLGSWGQSAKGVLKSWGIVHIPVVLVEFQDVGFQAENDSMRISNMLNETNFRTNNRGAQGSVRDYFMDQSYGLFTPNFHVLGKVRLSKNRAYYGKNSSTSKNVNILEMNKEAVELATAAGVDFSPFVENRIVPLIMFLHAGPGEHDAFEAGREDYIWAHFSEVNSFQAANTNFKSYFVGCELHQTYTLENNQPQVSTAALSGIGVICHELSHALGLPDFYHTNTDPSNTIYQTPDLFDVMDYGQWMNEGHRPLGYSAYERSYMGWLRITELADETAQKSLAPLHWNETDFQPHNQRKDRAYLLRNSANSQEYFIFENRQPSKWYPSSLAKGMLVFRVRYDNFDWAWNRPNNNATALRYVIVPADNQYQNHKTPNVSLEHYSGDFFGVNDQVRELSAHTTPNLQWQSGAPESALTNIRVQEDSYVTFDYTANTLTAISSPPQENANGVQWYDLSGRLVDHPIGKGIFISQQGKQFLPLPK